MSELKSALKAIEPREIASGLPALEIELPNGVLREIDDLKILSRALLQRSFSPDKAIAIKAGAIDRRVFPFERMNIANPTEHSARFHDHERMEVVLVPLTQDVNVPTLISNRASVSDAFRSLLEDGEFKRISGEHMPAHFENVLDDSLRALLKAHSVDRQYEVFDSTVRRIHGVKAYPFFEAIQRRIGTQVVEIFWNAYDVCMLGRKCIHARDIRSQNTRETEGQLRYIVPNGRAANDE